jgi:hypothetical protein
LPGAACDRVITEYFVRGAGPTQLCQEHSLFAVPIQMVSTSGTTEVAPASSPARSAETSAAVATAAPPQLVVAPGAADDAEKPKKKRGFWGRLFGKGDRDEVDAAKK